MSLNAQDRIDHFQGEPAETLEQAVANFTQYNRVLATLLGEEISYEDMAAIHQLTYTLENALEKMNEELIELADTLEELHIASERADFDTMRSSGEAYLRVAEILRGLGH